MKKGSREGQAWPLTSEGSDREAFRRVSGSSVRVSLALSTKLHKIIKTFFPMKVRKFCAIVESAYTSGQCALSPRA